MERDSYLEKVNTPIGIIYLLFQAQALTALTFTYPQKIHWKRTAVSEQAVDEIEKYFAGKIQVFSIQVQFLKGTMFQRKVWKTLSEVPYGETRTYKWIAEKICKPAGARAVGQALRLNPIPIILPCHRVVCSSKKLGGYSSGLEVKEFLLRLEKNKGFGD